jgi:hypothetical protein
MTPSLKRGQKTRLYIWPPGEQTWLDGSYLVTPRKEHPSMLIQPSKIVTGNLLPELPKPEYKALRALERAMQVRGGPRSTIS